MKKVIVLALFLCLGCMTAQQQPQPQINQRLDNIDKHLQAVIDNEVRNTCAVTVCGKPIKLQSVTKLECFIVGRMLEQITDDYMDCKDVPGQHSTPL